MFEGALAGLMGQPQQQQYNDWLRYSMTASTSPYYTTYSTGISAGEPKDAEPIKGRHYTTMISDDLVDSPTERVEEPPKEEPLSEFKQLSNHAFHKLLREFTDLTQLCVQSIL